MTALLGRVLGRDGAVYRVAAPEGEVRAVVSGALKRAHEESREGARDREAPKVVVGDVVRLEPEPGGELFRIAGVEPRRSLLERRTPEGRGTRPVAANVDQVVVVAATVDPAPVPQLFDRLLVLAEADSLPAIVIVNKVDLDPGTALAERMRRAGYEVFGTSARTGEGLDALADRLHRRTSVVTGPSGVGKSSLLNAIEPGLRLRTGEISAKLRRGKQTTVSAVMIPLAQGGFLLDTPGFSEVGLWDVVPRELASCFPEMRPLISRCRYADCRHLAEPGCAVRDAVDRGEVAADRYESYRALLGEAVSQQSAWE
ncbi:MAG TPA: ribosome small subunit-dependent GTPase A [Gemmatimonadales bacterium]|nr:ribosome small subunit-dependent GTPase A [Gemmatimonadales bacterium]